MSEARRVVLFGGSSCCEGEAEFEAAEHFGRLIAARGWVTVTGGYGGTMLAASRGAARQGGKVIGVTCGIFKSAPNAYLSEVIDTADLFERLRRLIELGDGYVALPGSTGTLAELALVWELLNKSILAPRPVVCWGEFWRPVVEVFAGDSVRDPHVPPSGEATRRSATAAPASKRKRGAWLTIVNDYDAAMTALEANNRTD